MTIRELFVY